MRAAPSLSGGMYRTTSNQYKMSSVINLLELTVYLFNDLFCYDPKYGIYESTVTVRNDMEKVNSVGLSKDLR